MASALKLVQGPAQSPLTLDEVKAHLRVDDADEDSLIESYIAAAVGYAESFMGRSLIDTTWDYVFDAWPLELKPLKLPRSPLIEVISVDAEGVAFTDFLTDLDSEPGRIYLSSTGSWPTTSSSTSVGRIRFRAGYVDLTGSPTGDVPDEILAAVKLIVGTLYAQRETLVVAASVAQIPWGAEQLLRQHRVELGMA